MLDDPYSPFNGCAEFFTGESGEEQKHTSHAEYKESFFCVYCHTFLKLNTSFSSSDVSFLVYVAYLFVLTTFFSILNLIIFV